MLKCKCLYTNQPIVFIILQNNFSLYASCNLNSESSTAATVATAPAGSNTAGSLSYDGNAADSGVVPIDSGAYASGATVVAKANTGNLAKSGYAFAGWTTSLSAASNSYASGTRFSFDATAAKLYAVWIPTTLTFASSGTGISVTGYANSTQPTGALLIPPGVTAIGSNAFYKCTGLTSVTLPQSLVVIGASAFGESMLSSIQFPDSVTNIGTEAFTNTNLTTAVRLKTATSKMKLK